MKNYWIHWIRIEHGKQHNLIKRFLYVKISPRTISSFLEFMNINPKLPGINKSGV